MKPFTPDCGRMVKGIHRHRISKETSTSRLIINSYDEFTAFEGRELDASDQSPTDQDRINPLADAALNHQWIHMDTGCAKKESPYQSTIAHGYLTFSLLSYLQSQIIKVSNIKMLTNYGMDKMHFGQAAVTGSRMRMVTKLHAVNNLHGICKTKIDFKIEVEGQRKPVLEGVATFLYCFK